MRIQAIYSGLTLICACTPLEEPSLVRLGMNLAGQTLLPSRKPSRSKARIAGGTRLLQVLKLFQLSFRVKGISVFCKDIVEGA